MCFKTDPNFSVTTTAIPTDIAATRCVESSHVSVLVRSDFDIVNYNLDFAFQQRDAAAPASFISMLNLSVYHAHL